MARQPGGPKIFKLGLIMDNIVFKRAYRATHRADRAALFRALLGRVHGPGLRPRHGPSPIIFGPVPCSGRANMGRASGPWVSGQMAIYTSYVLVLPIRSGMHDCPRDATPHHAESPMRGQWPMRAMAEPHKAQPSCAAQERCVFKQTNLADPDKKEK